MNRGDPCRERERGAPAPQGGLGSTHMEPLIDYIGSLKVSQGHGAGDPFPVLPWQRRFLKGAFADHVEEAALSYRARRGQVDPVRGDRCSVP